MTIDKARDLARLYFDEVFNRGNLDVIEQLVAPGFMLFIPPSLGEGPKVHGLAGFRQLALGTRAGFSDLRFDVHDVTANDDTVMVSWTMSGTHDGDWQGIPATGRRVSLVGVDVFKVADGRIVEERIHGDFLGMLRQLGAIT